jgi:hypothetical protein
MAITEIRVDGEPESPSPGDLRELLETEIWPLIAAELDGC